MIDPAPTLHAAFERQRDATDDPAALFDLAVAEARAIDALATAAPAWRLGSLTRVLDGGREGTRDGDLAWAAERLDAVIPTLEGRARAGAHDVLFRHAVEIEDFAAAHRHACAALSVWSTLAPPADPREIADACERVFSSAPEPDASVLSRWTEAERAVADPRRQLKLLAATAHAAWMAMETTPPDEPRALHRRRAATEAWVDAAVARWKASAEGADRAFAAAGAAEALGVLTELETLEGDRATVHAAATAWREAAHSASDAEAAQHASAVLAALER